MPPWRGRYLGRLLHAAWLILAVSPAPPGPAPAPSFSCVAGWPCQNLGPIGETVFSFSSSGRLRLQYSCSRGEDPDAIQDIKGVQVSRLDVGPAAGLANFTVSAGGANLTGIGFPGQTDVAAPLKYELCWCQHDLAAREDCSNSSGYRHFVGFLQVQGVSVQSYGNCQRGQTCVLQNLGGVEVQAGDKLAPLNDCNSSSTNSQDFIQGFPGKFLETQDGRIFNFSHDPVWSSNMILQARAGIYKLCFCRPKPSYPGSCSSVSDFAAHAGFLSVAGPYRSQDFTCVLGQVCRLTPFSGLHLSDLDRIVVLPSCGKPSVGTLGNATFVGPDTVQGDLYTVGTWLVSTTKPGSYEVCWCAAGNACNQPLDFLAVSGELTLQCPPGYYIDNEFCKLCDKDNYCPGGVHSAREPCPHGSSTAGNTGAEDISKCLCRPGYFGVQNNRSGATVCHLCQMGRFSYRPGETTCYNGIYTCVMGQSCQQLGPVPGSQGGAALSPAGRLRAKRTRCEGGDRLRLSASSPFGNASVTNNSTGSVFGFGAEPVELGTDGSYVLCWCDGSAGGCSNGETYLTLLGSLVIQGPKRMAVQCIIGRSCVINIGAAGVGLLAGDRLIVAYSCGSLDPLPVGMPGTGIAENDGSGSLHFIPRKGSADDFLRSEPGIYFVCFCRPNGPDGLPCDRTSHFQANVGYLRAEGPNWMQTGYACAMGGGCTVGGLKGFNLRPGDKAMLVDNECGSSCSSTVGCQAVRPSGLLGPNGYELGTVDTSFTPGTWKLCWCSAVTHCEADADFNVHAASIALACVNGSTVVKGVCEVCCTDCFLLRYSISGDGADSICNTDITHIVTFTVLALVSPLLAMALSFFLGLPVPLQDIGHDEEGTIVTTSCEHHLLGWRKVPVRFRGSCVPWLDDRKERYLVSLIDGNKLLLLDAKGEPVGMPCDTSTGELWIPCLYSPIGCGFLWVPYLAWAALFLAIVIAMLMVNTHSVLELVVIALFSALVAIVLHVVRRHSAKCTPMYETCQAYRKRLAASNPKPQAGPRGASRALKVETLLDLYNFFQAFIRGRNMYYICPNIVKPLTKPEQLSFAELAGPSMVDWFVSHFWGMPFKHFVASIDKHSKSVASADSKKISYWVCTFSNNQWKVADEVGNGQWQESSFYKALRCGVCRGTAMVLDEQALPLTRSWCLFEVLQTSLLAEEEKSFAGLLLCTPSGVLNYGTASMDIATALARRLSSLRLQDAKASCLEDKQMIDGLVESMPGGFEMMNDFVRDGIRKCLQTMKVHFDGEMTRLVSALEESSNRLVSQRGPGQEETKPPAPLSAPLSLAINGPPASELPVSKVVSSELSATDKHPGGGSDFSYIHPHPVAGPTVFGLNSPGEACDEVCLPGLV